MEGEGGEGEGGGRGGWERSERPLNCILCSCTSQSFRYSCTYCIELHTYTRTFFSTLVL